jgi:diaminopimelate epimerase
MMRFYKYQALGNDYIVLDSGSESYITKEKVKKMCDRHYGIGSDGVLYGAYDSKRKKANVVIYNADGTIAEISGNGIRIFAQYLKDHGFIAENYFEIESIGRIIKGYFMNNGEIVMEMGEVDVDETDMTLNVADINITGRYVNIGNPHFVVMDDLMSESLIHQLAPGIEMHQRFPKRTNVQFLRVIDRKNIEILIWERGSGYTLASGSSSIAAAAAAVKKGLCDPDINVYMKGGELKVIFDENMHVILIGDAQKVYEGTM